MGQFIVTTEADFQTALDADPTDWQTRLVFADWLQERNDPRADGYRALARVGRRPLRIPDGAGLVSAFVSARQTSSATRAYYGYCLLPSFWFERLDAPPNEQQPRRLWKQYRTRREAEDAAALAFSKLPPERRTKLLGATPTPRKPKGKK
jgi:uncharacterized protein (TIGR02996 family)